MPDIELGVLAILGICVAGGVIGAFIFQKLKVPQVVGYIVVGVLIGDTGFGLLHPSDIQALSPFNNFALGLIGFLVGGELSAGIFKKYGKQFTAILIGEGVAAFLLVGIVSTLILYFVCHNWVTALAAGIVFGAIASATDPASTIDVLWEYRSAGVLTTAIIAIVALDDALAMTLYGLGTSIATILVQGSGHSIWATLLHTFVELGGAILLGVICGFVLDYVLSYLPQSEKRLGISIGLLLVCIGLAVAFHMDLILATMAVGIVLINKAPNRSKKLFETVRSFSTPIYIIFFVLVGARLSLDNMPVWVWGLVAAYVAMRSLGKWIGAFWGGRISKAEKPVQNYLGMAIFAQGGVAVGLSIVASNNLQHIEILEGLNLGDMIIFTVTATTLCVQLIGPVFARMAVKKAGEIGCNVTEEDVMAEMIVDDVVDKNIVPLYEGTPLETVVQHFADQDTFVYPVVSNDGKIIGVLTFENLKELLNERDTWQWLLVGDVMQPARHKLLSTMNLAEALKEMGNNQVESLPVIESQASGKLLGVLDIRAARRSVNAELVKRRTVTG
ncbi:cation:proton antiporter [Pontiella agarivorans]|uniref:Cation:proton antiporter n=1 Tax=Pontiella agarivorans TaxID=3038953 RepID=A0ABU5MUX1_9BACT|nr:cation:proton antiporter [Pontiella agarivorans]MDZ8118010.1 cation:proton antiporter [Pontiella agarivorans]